MKDFVAWMDNEIAIRGWTRAELARRANLDQGTISRVANGLRRPGRVFCSSIARAFGYSAELVYREAGLLPQVKIELATLEELKDIVSHLTPEEANEFLAFGRLKIELSKKSQRK